MINLCRLCKKRVFYADSVSFSSQCGIKTVNVMIEKSAEKAKRHSAEMEKMIYEKNESGTGHDNVCVYTFGMRPDRGFW